MISFSAKFIVNFICKQSDQIGYKLHWKKNNNKLNYAHKVLFYYIEKWQKNLLLYRFNLYFVALINCLPL